MSKGMLGYLRKNKRINKTQKGVLLFFIVLYNQVKKKFMQCITLSTFFSRNLLAMKVTDLHLTQKITKYNNMMQRYDDLVHVGKISNKAKRQIISQFGHRASSTIADVREILRVLSELQNRTLNVAATQDRKDRLLAIVDNKLAYLSIFCIGKSKNEKIQLNSVVDDIINIYATEVAELKLTVKKVMLSADRKVYYDKLLLKQLLINLLNESILGSRPGGIVTISFAVRRNKNKYRLVFIIRDNGFGISEQEVGNGLSECPTSFLSLDFNTLRGIVKSLNGDLDMECSVGNGKEITLTLPCNIKEKKESINATKTNVVKFEPISG